MKIAGWAQGRPLPPLSQPVPNFLSLFLPATNSNASREQWSLSRLSRGKQQECHRLRHPPFTSLSSQSELTSVRIPIARPGWFAGGTVGQICTQPPVAALHTPNPLHRSCYRRHAMCNGYTGGIWHSIGLREAPSHLEMRLRAGGNRQEWIG